MITKKGGGENADKNFAENMLESIGIGEDEHEKKGRKGGKSSGSKAKKKK